MRRATLACASVLLLAGFAAGCGDDADKDSSSKQSSRTSPSESGQIDPTIAPSDGSSTDPGTSTDPGAGAEPANAAYCAAARAAGASKEIADLKVAVNELVETLPDSANAKVKRGLDYLQGILESAKDQSDFVDKVQAAKGANSKAVSAYGAFEGVTCPPQAAPEAPAPTTPQP